MIKQFLSIVSILVLSATMASAGTGNITGRVTTELGGEPIPFASVQIEGSHQGTMADTMGNFNLSDVHCGRQVVIVSAVGYATQRFAVTVEDNHTIELSTELAATLIDAGGIVITGTRTPRYVKDVPVFTEVVSKASIEDKSAHNIFEALEGESGVRVEQQCQGCNFSILRMQGLGADHTQVLLDGQPVYTGLASVYGLQQLSTADIDQIEIVKGAGSALYGSNAVAGAINIVSAIPRKTEANVNVEFGEHGTNRYSISAGTRKDNLGLFLFAQQTEEDELDETGDLNAPGGVENPDGWIDRVRSKGQNLGLNLFLDDMFTADRLVVRGRLTSETRQGGWLTDQQFENPFAPGTERIITDRYSGQAEYQAWLAKGTELSANISFSNHRRNATNDTFLSDYEEAYGEAPAVDLLRPYVADENLLVANLSIVQPIAHTHRLLLGTQFSHNDLEESGMYLDIDTQEPYSSTSKKRAYEIGAYLQDEFKVNNKLEVIFGLRFDYHNSEDEFRGSGDVLPQGLEPMKYDESSVNPRFSVKYAMSDDFILRGSAGSGYRVPYGFSEDLHLCSGSPRVYKGGDLKPEKSYSYSLTADYTGRNITASVNAYRTELTDAISFVDADSEVSDLGYTYQWENIDNAYVMGVEVNGSISVARGLVISARFEMFEGKYDNGRGDWMGTVWEESSRNISRYPQVSGGLKADLTKGTWELVADADFKGKMYIDLSEPDDPADVKIHETESFVILNAKLSKEILDNYVVYIGAKNLNDYTQKEKHIDDAAFMYAPVYGRHLYGGIQISL
ncbi:MAG: TonB-dependent receptor [bacterium]